MRGRRAARRFAAVFALALLLRLTPVPFHRFRPERVVTLDSPLYLELGTNLRERGSFRRTQQDGESAVENPGPVEVFRTPGYPLFLAVFGGSRESGVAEAICTQIVLDALAAALVAALAATVMPAPWAFVAGALAALDPGHIVYANMIMSDTVFAALLIAGVWLLGRPSPRHALAGRIAAGVAFSAAAAVRPVGVLASLAGALFLAVRREERRRFAAFLVTALAFPVAWTVRNGVGAGVWSVSDAGGYNLCVVAGAKVEAAAEGISRGDAERRLIERVVRESPGADSAARSAAFRRVGWEVIRAHPGLACREAVVSAAEFALAGERRNLLRLFGREGGTEASPALGESTRDPRAVVRMVRALGGLESLVVAGQVAWNLLLWLAACVGAFELARRRRWAELVLFVSVIAYETAASLIVAHGRMRLPVVGVLAVLAALGIFRVAGRRRAAAAQADVGA
ncbi:MAG TPA: hypothetical protein VMT19_05835 [Thermoanaerobaculaceae bacterium]|nr:hypothetical protein [Thermoanaerobaculaceae bacterium]